MQINNTTNMDKKTKDAIDNLLLKICKMKDPEQYLKYIINETNEKLSSLEELIAELDIKEYLLDFFNENGYTIDDETIDKIYTMPENIKEIIENMKIVSFEKADNKTDNYINVTIQINSIQIHTYVDYRRNGCKTEGTLDIIFDIGSHSITFGDDYDFISDSLCTKNKLDNIYNKIKKNNTLKEMKKECNMSNDEFMGFLKLLFLIPKHWYGYIY